MCNTGANHWVAVVKGQDGQWWHYDDRKGDGTATKTNANKAASDKQIWHSPVLIYTRTRGQRKEHETVLIEEEEEVGEEECANRVGDASEPPRKRARADTRPATNVAQGVATAVDCCVCGH
jgi:hypothetical protein